MSDMKDRVASFHEEVMHDADFTLPEPNAASTAKFLSAARAVRLKMKFRNSSMP